MSKKLTPTQQRYSAQEREMLAIVYSLRQWRCWLEGAEITVLSDHHSLQSFRTKAEQPARMLRFLDTIEHFNVTIKYRKGKQNVLADWLSRPSASQTVYPVEEGEGDELDQDGNGHRNEEEPLERVDQVNWVDLIAVYEYLSAQEPLPPRLTPQFVQEHFIVNQERLYLVEKDHNNPEGPPILRMVPTSYTAAVETAARIHNSGHVSIGTIRRRMARYWHPQQELAYSEAYRTCQHCQLMQKHDPTPQGLTPIPPVPPLRRWAIDHTGPMTIGNAIRSEYLLNAVEYASDWAEGVWVPSTSSEYTIQFLEFLFDRFGKPAEIISDNAATLGSSAQLNAFLARNGVKLIKTTPYHPRTNGKVEQLNGRLKRLLTAWFAIPGNTDKHKGLRWALRTYNTTIHDTRYSPFFLLYGTVPKDQQPYEAFLTYEREPSPEEKTRHAQELASQEDRKTALRYTQSARYTRDVTRARLQESKAQFRTYAVGDWVLRVRQRRHKLEPFYDGPWQITQVYANHTYSLQSPGGVHIHNRYNAELLFPAYVRDGHPVASLWYASRPLLMADRRRQLEV